MNLDSYQESALRTAIDDKEKMKIYSLLGLAGESGELLDYLKKVHFHGHALDKEKVIEELGDTLWYIAAAAKAYDISLEEVASKNIEKLKKRYPNGFSKEASINRK